jgi:hypothetical protein
MYELIHSLEQDKKDTGETDEDILSLLKIKLDFSQDVSDYKLLVLSEHSYNNLSNYKVPTEIRTDVLKTLPNRKYYIQAKNICYKYEKNNDSVRVMILNRDDERLLYFFGIRLSDGLLMSDYHIKENDFKWFEDKEVIEQYYAAFMILITYIELTDVTFDICYSNTKRGDIMKNNHLKNELSFNVIQVNTNWNTTKLHIGNSFQVKGHFRLQPHGSVDNKYYKYIFIDTYEKTGIIKRKAGKEINT